MQWSVHCKSTATQTVQLECTLPMQSTMRCSVDCPYTLLTQSFNVPGTLCSLQLVAVYSEQSMQPMCSVCTLQLTCSYIACTLHFGLNRSAKGTTRQQSEYKIILCSVLERDIQVRYHKFSNKGASPNKGIPLRSFTITGTNHTFFTQMTAKTRVLQLEAWLIVKLRSVYCRVLGLKISLFVVFFLDQSTFVVCSM